MPDRGRGARLQSPRLDAGPRREYGGPLQPVRGGGGANGAGRQQPGRGEHAKERLMAAFGSSMHRIAAIGDPTLVPFPSGEEISLWTCVELLAHSATAHVAIHAPALRQPSTVSTARIDAVASVVKQIESGPATAVIARASDAPLSA